MAALCKKIAGSEDFQRFILLLIFISAASMGFEAVPALADGYDNELFLLDCFIQSVFVFEISIRLIAFAPKLSDFFRDRWNSFDFAIVALSLVPAIGTFALIARLLRVLRVLRFLSVSASLRSFLGRLQESFDELLFALVIAAIVAYIFVIAGHYLFADLDPGRWGGLKEAVLSVFYLSLFQDVPGFVGPLVAHSLFCLLFFVAFYIALVGLALSVIVAAVLQGQERKG
jgi:voltage-gated sodium channel